MLLLQLRQHSSLCDSGVRGEIILVTENTQNRRENELKQRERKRERKRKRDRLSDRLSEDFQLVYLKVNLDGARTKK